MPLRNLADLASALPPAGRLLGLDLGTKTIGLALSDERRVIASPLQTLRRTRFTRDAEALQAVADRHAVVGLVLGLPVNMDGSEGPRCQSARQFAENLETLAGFTLPMAFWDERLSTVAVTRTLLAADISRRRRGEVVDKLAAGYILQGALDALAAYPMRP